MPVPAIQVIAFILLSVVLVYWSRKPLQNIEAHGFTRFFAWETILALLVLQAPVWHAHMFSPLQLLSWTLLFASALLAVMGFRALKTFGQVGHQRQDNSLFAFEKTERLVTKNIYALIRHPMYAALIFLAWGAYLKDIGVLSTILVIVASVALWFTAKRDELECLAYFGGAYANYMKVSKRFVPFVI
ncbi:MAG TPA: methyltransferase [Burkholderiaceae bacterium]|nr:methyltransferase [Burkholderiaceae bacterium]